MNFKKLVRDKGSDAPHIEARKAGCGDCSRIIEKYDKLDTLELAFDEGRRMESRFDKEYEEHMRTFHRMIR